MQEIFDIIINAFTFDEINESLLNKSIDLF